MVVKVLYYNQTIAYEYKLCSRIENRMGDYYMLENFRTLLDFSDTF